MVVGFAHERGLGVSAGGVHSACTGEVGATALQIAEYRDGRQRIVACVGSARTDAELGVLIEEAEKQLSDPGQPRSSRPLPTYEGCFPHACGWPPSGQTGPTRTGFTESPQRTDTGGVVGVWEGAASGVCPLHHVCTTCDGERRPARVGAGCTT